MHGAVIVERPIPGIVPSLLPPTGSLPLGVTEGAVAHGEQEEDVCGYVGTSRFGWSRNKEWARQAQRRKKGLHVKKAMEQRCGNRHILVSLTVCVSGRGECRREDALFDPLSFFEAFLWFS